jgi:uncharacterized protein (DUF58 family)
MVLPNRNTIGLVALLLAMWYAGISQSNAAAYLLCFVIGAMAAVSILHAWANVRGITLTADPIKPAFAGDQLCVHLTAAAHTRRAHPGINVRALHSRASATFGEIKTSQPQKIELSMRALTRGRHEAIEVQLSTLFPLGFFTAQRAVTIVQPHIIYPRPEGSLPLPPSAVPAPHHRDGLRVAGDDFAGTRGYQAGESQRHIDWKAVARGQPLLIKQWAGEADQTLHLDWDAVLQADIETRIRQLARWVLLAERSGASYSLRLPGLSIAPSRGDAHFHACLRALALYPAAR